MKAFTALLLFSSLCLSSVFASECIYTADDGTKYDLRALEAAPDDFVFKRDGDAGVVFSFSFAVCKNVNKKCQNIPSPSAEFLTTPIGEGCRVLGAAKKREFKQIDPSDPKKGMMIRYFDGDSCNGNQKRTATVRIECNENVSGLGEFQAVEGEGTCDYTYIFPSQYGCPASGHKFGAIVLISFFSAATLYFGGGALYRWKKMGLTGIEVVPHLDFWRELPGLVMDGCKKSFEVSKQLTLLAVEKFNDWRSKKSGYSPVASHT
eukprot:GILI01009943.1.p1 GENE.GILI01009943.1~~GILI01009943.1.p1  ORF type:complete len:263 (-),score=93.86 GILI01009943.1:98-886(-)